MSKRCLLTLNAGSSSLKFAAFTFEGKGGEPEFLLRGQLAGIGTQAHFKAEDGAGQPLPSPDTGLAEIRDHSTAIQLAIQWLQQQLAGWELAAVGHRVVHGGERFQQPAQVTPAVLAELEKLCPLAPHHQPHNLAAIRALAELAPQLPQIACFDTAFHARQPALAQRLPIPQQYADKGIRRYGFHGLSYEYIRNRLESLLGDLPRRVLVAHLGNGASLCGLQNGESIVTSMGFSTLDGLMMGTRSGSLDPGVILHFMRNEGMDEQALTQLLYNQCGLQGVSGLSADMQVLMNSEEPAAQAAIELFCYTLVRQLGSHVAVLEGLDELVFTGGIGENAAFIRERVCQRLNWLGIQLDATANQRNAWLISAAISRIRVWVIPTNEELVIARHTKRLLQAASPAPC